MISERASFLRMAVVFQGGLFLVAVALGRVTGWSAESQFVWSLPAVLLGLAITLPMLLFLWFVYHSRLAGLQEVQRIVRDVLGRQLSVCGWLDLAFLSLLAGVSEEFLFRGFLESLFSRWGILPGIIVSNLIFGFCHAVTPTYALLAAFLGCYLSLTLRLTPEANLLVPIIGHSLYDFVAFTVIRNDYRRGQSQEPPDCKESPWDTDSADCLNNPTEH